MKQLMMIITITFITLLGACETNDTDTVTVLTSSGYEPYEMVDTDGNLTGFDIELMEALAELVGIDIVWSDVDFDGIIASLQSGQAEIAIAGLSPTEERLEMVDFSDVYYNSESGMSNFLVFDATDNTITGLDDLSGLIVGAQIGTVQAGLLSAISDEYGFTVDLRSNNTMIVEEVKAGRIDVLVVESEIASSILESNTTLSKVGFESYLDDVLGSAIAFQKGSEYTALFNEALQTMKDNGELDALIAKWFTSAN
jgi:polar amino acid transport system substrate-binding protein